MQNLFCSLKKYKNLFHDVFISQTSLYKGTLYPTFPVFYHYKFPMYQLLEDNENGDSLPTMPWYIGLFYLLQIFIQNSESCLLCHRLMYAVSQILVCFVSDSCLLCHRLMFALSQTRVYIAPDLCLLCLRLVFAVSQTGSFKKARFNRLKESETFETQTKMCELWITKLLVKKGSIKKACFNHLKERSWDILNSNKNVWVVNN